MQFPKITQNQQLIESFIFSKIMSASVSTMTAKTKIKIVFLGGQSVGKSSIIQKYIHDRFDESSNPTIGIDFLAKNITHKGKGYRLQLWDTAGQQRFRSLIPSYLKDANCALIVFDVTSKSSLDEIGMWANIFNENKNGQGFIFFLGNKIDLQNRQITEEQARLQCQKLGSPYIQISAKTGQNLQNLFLKIVEYISDKTYNKISISPRKKSVTNTGLNASQNKQKEAVDDSNINVAEKKNQQQVTINNLVLKNQKIGPKSEQRKGCC